VTIRGCPESFKTLVQQWEVQRLSQYLESKARTNVFTQQQKNAWTKWHRLYNMVLVEAGFPQLQVGVSHRPANVTAAQFARRMLQQAEAMDAMRNGDSMDKFYKELVSSGQRDGDIARRRKRNAEEDDFL